MSIPRGAYPASLGKRRHHVSRRLPRKMRTMPRKRAKACLLVHPLGRVALPLTSESLLCGGLSLRIDQIKVSGIGRAWRVALRAGKTVGQGGSAVIAPHDTAGLCIALLLVRWRGLGVDSSVGLET